MLLRLRVELLCGRLDYEAVEIRNLSNLLQENGLLQLCPYRKLAGCLWSVHNCCSSHTVRCSAIGTPLFILESETLFFALRHFLRQISVGAETTRVITLILIITPTLYRQARNLIVDDRTMIARCLNHDYISLHLHVGRGG